MEVTNKYCVYTGTTRGVIETTSLKPDEKLSYVLPDVASEVTTLEWGRSDDEILVGYKAGHLSLFNTLQNKFIKTINNLEGDGHIVGVGNIENKLIIAKHDGIINIWQKKNDFFSLNLNEKSTLNVMSQSKFDRNVVATGGEFNDLNLWDLNTQQSTFKAKPLPHDELNLPVPTSARAITFFNENLPVCATKEGHVLLYDPRAQRRPVVKFNEPKASYTCISNFHKDKQCLVGTARGYLQLIDMKSPGKSLKTLTTFTGSVTSVVADPFEPIVISTSLDKFLRVHNIETKALLYKQYMKQSLSRVLMRIAVKQEKVEVKDDAKVDEEYEEIFNQMEVIGEKRKTGKDKTKRKKIKG